MDDKPTITAALRDAVRHFMNFHQEKRVEMDEGTFSDMCDAIDSIHGRVCSELDEARHEVDWMHAELHGWETDAMKLPVDADGEPIRIGDKVVYSHNGVRTAMAETVRWIATGEHETHITTDRTSYSHAEYLCHYHAPTVEDVLRKFALDIAEVLGGDDFLLSDDDELFAEYATKLRLAEDSD